MAVLRLTLSAVRRSILLPPRGAEHTCSWAGPSGAFQLQQHKTDMSQAQETSRAAHGTRLWYLLLSLRSGCCWSSVVRDMHQQPRSARRGSTVSSPGTIRVAKVEDHAPLRHISKHGDRSSRRRCEIPVLASGTSVGWARANPALQAAKSHTRVGLGAP